MDRSCETMQENRNFVVKNLSLKICLYFIKFSLLLLHGKLKRICNNVKFISSEENEVSM